MRYFRGHQLLQLRDDLGEMRSGLEPFPRVFFISRIMLHEGYVEARPLTVHAFFGAIFRNIAWDVRWWLQHLAWLTGFIDFDERRIGEADYRGAWRWRWWAPRVGRAPDREKRT